MLETDVSAHKFDEIAGANRQCEVGRGEGTLRSTDSSIGEVDYVLRDFKYYAPVDKALFSIDPPEGWSDCSQKRAVKDERSSIQGKTAQ